MKELTPKDKESLVALLERHYTIKEKNFINAIASNDEERLDLTLKAYTMGTERTNTPTNVPTTPVPTNTQVVVINQLHSKLQFVKAVRDVKNIPLREAKDFADQLLMWVDGGYGRFCSSTFVIGDALDSKFSKEQWAEMCECLGGGMDWTYV